MLENPSSKEFIPDDDLALKDFLKGFMKSRKNEAAKKQDKKSKKNVSHSISGGNVDWGK